MNGKLTRFERGSLQIDNPEAEIQRLVAQGLSRAAAKHQLAKLLHDEIWVNDEYQVNVDRNPHHGFAGMKVVHLSIKRRDKAPLHDWRDLQAIKDMLIAPEAEAVELYPARSRVVDTANQYHLFVFMPPEAGAPYPTVPLGWTEGMTTGRGVMGAVQRPLD